MNIKLTSRWTSAIAVTMLAACGGGGGGAGPTPVQPTASGATGVVTAASASSITVNGVAFATGSSRIRIDDSPSTADQLKQGMLVKVRGSDDGRSGNATEVEVENEVRGPVQSVNAASSPQSFTVGSVKIVVDANTIYANLAPNDFSALRDNLFVEVHGLRDAAGNLQATRIEGKGPRNPAAAEVDELRGRVSPPIAGGSSGGAFNLGPVVVTFTATTNFVPAGRCSAADLTEGRLVEVHGAFTSATAFAATRIDCEDAEDDRVRPGDREKNEIEGFVTEASVDVGAKTGTFKVNGQAVTFTATVQFRGGSVEDLIDGAKVEVEGTMNGTTLVAREIHFKRVRVIFTTVPTQVDTAARTLEMFGKTVRVDDSTELRTALGQITANTTRVEVRAFVDTRGSIIAERVEAAGNSGGGRDIVQARVVAENEATFTLGLLDSAAPINAALAGTSNDNFEGVSDTPIGRAAFFAAVVPSPSAGTLVKLKGSWSGNVLTVEEAELED